MKANDVLYQLQKLIKMLRKNNLDKVYFSAKLKSMVEVCKEYELKEEKKILFQLIGDYITLNVPFVAVSNVPLHTWLF
jgi:chaperonin cofactor prefoldin